MRWDNVKAVESRKGFSGNSLTQHTSPFGGFKWEFILSSQPWHPPRPLTELPHKYAFTTLYPRDACNDLFYFTVSRALPALTSTLDDFTRALAALKQEKSGEFNLRGHLPMLHHPNRSCLYSVSMF